MKCTTRRPEDIAACVELTLTQGGTLEDASKALGYTTPWSLYRRLRQIGRADLLGEAGIDRLEPYCIHKTERGHGCLHPRNHFGPCWSPFDYPDVRLVDGPDGVRFESEMAFDALAAETAA